MTQALKAFFPVVLIAYLLACLLFTQANLATVQSFGLAVTAGDRLAATWHDMVGMSSRNGSYLSWVISLRTYLG